MPAWTGRIDEGTIKALTVYVHTLTGGRRGGGGRPTGIILRAHLWPAEVAE